MQESRFYRDFFVPLLVLARISPLLVLARNEAPESYLEFSCGRDQQLTLTSNIHFHCVHPGKILAVNNVEQVLAKNSCRMRV